jgi:hypothetical protein
MQGTTLWQGRYNLTNTRNLASITRLLIRHSDAALPNLQPMLNGTEQLQSFTYDFFYDCNERTDAPQGTPLASQILVNWHTNFEIVSSAFLCHFWSAATFRTSFL